MVTELLVAGGDFIHYTMKSVTGLCSPALLIMIILAKGQGDSEAETGICPALCSCFADTVNCAYRHKDHIPLLPNDTTSLDFSGNFLPNLSASTFRNILNVHLQILKLSFCNISTMTKDAFNNMGSIEILDISGNDLSLSYLRTGLLGLTGSAIKSLNFSSQNSRFKKFKNGLFDGLSRTQITNMSFTDGYLEKVNVKGSLFSDLKNLNMLNLSYNYIRKINLAGLQSLRILDLSQNDLNALPLFKGKKRAGQAVCLVPHLELLNLDNNHITHLGDSSEYGKCLSNLRELYLRFNPISTIGKHQFLHMASLTTVNLDFLLVISRLRLEDYAFTSPTLRRIRLGAFRHQLTSEQLNIFENCSSLEKLELTNFRFSSLRDHQIMRLLSPVLKLKLLAIRFASLIGIPSVISEMKELEWLSLRDNYIGHWGEDTFSKLTKLTYINLAKNRISVINQTSFPSRFLENVQTMNLSSNPYACTCDNYWFLQWANKNKRKLPSFPRSFLCYSPPYYNNRKISKYHPTFLECNDLQPYQKAVVASFAVLLIFVIIALLYKRYKWHLKYYMYLIRSKKEAVNLLQDGTYTYDAFVAYTEDDKNWVISNLMAVLEGQHGFRLCLHERDFLPGITILDQISETIEHSRKVILVLSNNFAKSQWCQYEILLAQHKLVEDGGSSLILILLDEVKGKYMTNCLSMLLRTMTYIRWTSNTEGKKLFWNKVVMSMK